MKKVSSITISLLVLLVGLAFAGNINIRESAGASTVRLTEAYDQAQLELKSYRIAPNATALFYLDNIAGFNQLDFYIGSVSSGNITTASCQPILSSGESIGSATILTSNTDLTGFKSMFYKMSIVNPVATTINVTANILVTK